MRNILRALVVTITACLFAMPAVSQQEKGDSELGLSGAFTVTNNDTSSASGFADFTYGYYFSDHDVIGLGAEPFVQKDVYNLYLFAQYRHLFGPKTGKVFPFVGGGGGFNTLHLNAAASATGSSSNTTYGLAVGEAGVKFFVSQRTAFEVAYNLRYISASGGSFAANSTSAIVFGFTHLFGGHQRR